MFRLGPINSFSKKIGKRVSFASPITMLNSREFHTQFSNKIVWNIKVEARTRFTSPVYRHTIPKILHINSYYYGTRKTCLSCEDNSFLSKK